MGKQLSPRQIYLEMSLSRANSLWSMDVAMAYGIFLLVTQFKH